MEFRVICISRTLAAGGESIGRTVAQRLGFRYVDEQIITRAAEEARIDPTVVAATEHHQPLLRRLLDKLALAIEAAGSPVSLGTGVPLDTAPVGNSAIPEDLRALIRSAIHDVARTGQAVIVGHAASMTLGGMMGVLRVLVTASSDTRAQRLAKEQSLSIAVAADAITASDRERRDYFRSFYSIADELPTHYDLVINTDVLTPVQAGEMILAVVALPSPAP
jgi:cytidylate kinase